MYNGSLRSVSGEDTDFILNQYSMLWPH